MASDGTRSGGPDWSLEAEAEEAGHRRVAGADEAGRGCLFGPVFAAAVVLDPAAALPGLDDSKRLTPAQREVLDVRIRETALAYAVRAEDAAAIDRLNILQASRLAVKRAVEALAPEPDFLLADALTVDVGIAQRSVIQGDRKSRSIAAASVLAKVARDRCMLAWDAVYPRYGLKAHKGYGAPAHLAALEAFGCTPLHRFSYAPVARCLTRGGRPAETVRSGAEAERAGGGAGMA